MIEDNEVIRYCPHCCNTAPQRLLYSHDYDGTSKFYDLEDGTPSTSGPGCTYELRCCRTCDEVLLYHSVECQDDQLMYPKGPDLGPYVPSPVKTCYSEAARIQHTAPNAYAVMIRRALEAICDNRGVTAKTLNQSLEQLAARGEIPPVLTEMTTLLRELGNSGAHHDPVGVTIPMTWAMDHFFRAIVEYVYVAPGKIQELKRQLNRQ